MLEQFVLVVLAQAEAQLEAVAIYGSHLDGAWGMRVHEAGRERGQAGAVPLHTRCWRLWGRLAAALCALATLRLPAGGALLGCLSSVSHTRFHPSLISM